MSSEEERKKREIFDGMSPKRQRRIIEKGYEKWNPFLPPKEPPLFSATEREKYRQTAELVSRFLKYAAETVLETSPSPPYVQAVRDMAFGLARGEERYQAMDAYCRWLVLSDEKSLGTEDSG